MRSSSWRSSTRPGTKALPTIKKLLTDSRVKVRRKAARVLGAVHAEVDQDDVKNICALLKSSDPEEVTDVSFFWCSGPPGLPRFFPFPLFPFYSPSLSPVFPFFFFSFFSCQAPPFFLFFKSVRGPPQRRRGPSVFLFPLESLVLGFVGGVRVLPLPPFPLCALLCGGGFYQGRAWALPA